MFVHISPYTYLQALLDSTSTSTSLRVEDRDPEDLVPHPVTVAVIPTLHLTGVSGQAHRSNVGVSGEVNSILQFEH